MPSDSVKQPTPLPERSDPEEFRLLAESLQLLQRLFIRLDEQRDRLLPGEAADDFHDLAIDMTARLDLAAHNWTGTPPEPPLPDLNGHGLRGKIGEVKRNTLRRCVEEFFAALGGEDEAGSFRRRAVSAASAALEAGAFIADSAGFKIISEGCATAKSICDIVVRRYDNWSSAVSRSYHSVSDTVADWFRPN